MDIKDTSKAYQLAFEKKLIDGKIVIKNVELQYESIE